MMTKSNRQLLSNLTDRIGVKLTEWFNAVSCNSSFHGISLGILEGNLDLGAADP
jgi:hypothetical protein